MTLIFKNKPSEEGRNVYLLLDRSGSMSASWIETLGSINGYVEKLENDVNVYLATFDSCGNEDYEVIQESTAGNWQNVTSDKVFPRGGTPLYDAVGKITSKMLADNPKRAVLVIMTDGEENSSKEYSIEAVKAKLKDTEEKDWPTVYLGADFKNVTRYATSTFNINSANSFNTARAMRGTAMGLMATKTATYFNADAGSAASATSMQWTDLEKSLVSGETEKTNELATSK